MMRSRAKLAYAQAQAAIDGRPDEITGPLLDGILRPLWAAYEVLAAARDARGPLALDLPERKVILNAEGGVDRVIVPERLAAHRLIEEFMIQANVAAAEALEAARQALIYRVHEEPSLEKMRALGEVMASIGLKLPKEANLRPALFNRILGMVEGSEHQLFLNEVVLRSQAQAVYAAENAGHFGLALRRYAHFTSPIRRYADRASRPDPRLPLRFRRAAGGHRDRRTRRDRPADLGRRAPRHGGGARDHRPPDRPPSRRPGRRDLLGPDSGVTRSGLFIKLDETGADGFVPISTLGADYFRHEEGRHALVGERTRQTFRLGDKVEVQLMEAAPVAGALRFEIAGSGGRVGTVAPARGGPRKGRPAPANRDSLTKRRGRRA